MSFWKQTPEELISSFRNRKNGKRRRNLRRKARKGCRTPLAIFDRIKITLTLFIVFLALTVLKMADNPLIGFYDAIKITYNNYQFLLLLVTLDILRQIHYLISERVSLYWKFFSKAIWFIRKPWSKLNPYTQYRLSRIFKWSLILVIGALVLGNLFSTEPVKAWMTAFIAIWNALPTILQFATYMLIGVGQFVLIFWFMSKGGVEVLMPEEIQTTFDDVWGQDQVVAKVRETLTLLEDPDAIEAKGGYVPGGILLWGPPGTGKTLIAEALAGETGKPFVLIEPGAFQAMFIGINILKVKSLYRRLRKLALRYGGVVAFFDEADVLGRRQLSGAQPRNRSSHSNRDPSCSSQLLLTPVGQLVAAGSYFPHNHDFETKNPMIVGGGGGDLGTLNAILASMQGLKKPRGLLNRFKRLFAFKPSNPPKYRILHVMATNMPDSLDEALLRPGRIDRIFRVGYPSKEGRIRTFRGYLSKVKNSITDEEVDRLATSSPYSSGAVIKDIVNEALMAAIRDDREVVEWRDIISAKSLKEHGVTDGFEYIDRERHAVAVHEACHAVTAYRLKKDFQIDVATIERRGSVGGFVSRVPVVERMFEWRSDAEHDIMIAIASLVGERMFFNDDNTNGVSSDLETATRLALVMESRWGMGTTLASHSVLVEGSAGPSGAGRKVDGQEGDLPPNSYHLGERVEDRLRLLYDRTKILLSDNRYHILSLAHAMEVFKTLNGADVEAVINQTKGPIIDGSVYSDCQVKAAIESYHDASVIFHSTGIGSPVLPLLTSIIEGDLSSTISNNVFVEEHANDDFWP
jgi:ATP-dependent Zn protease